MTSQERDELLIRIDERTKKTEQWQKEHSTYHNRASLAILGSLVAIIIALFGAIF